MPDRTKPPGSGQEGRYLKCDGGSFDSGNQRKRLVESVIPGGKTLIDDDAIRLARRHRHPGDDWSRPQRA